MTALSSNTDLAPLDLETLRYHLPAATQAALAGLEVLDRVDSTNLRLMKCRDIAMGRFCACLAEEQTAGRGRHGRTWISPRGTSLCLSLGIRLEPMEGVPGALPLALGVAVAETLRGFGARGIALKWPNDIYARGAKLGGILVESRRGSRGPGILVAGLGLNLHWQSGEGAAIGQAWTDLSRITPRPLPERNALASALIAALWAVLDGRWSGALESLHTRYASLDLLSGREVVVEAPDGRYTGAVQGIGAGGALRVRIDGRDREFSSGDVSVRLSP